VKKRSIVATTLLLASLLVLSPAVADGPGNTLGDGPPPYDSGAPSWIDFTLPDRNGDPVSLGRFIGKKPVLLVFWATWCPHCNEAVPRINRLHTDPATGEKVQILALDFLESREKVESFVRKKDVAYPVLLDRKGAVARMYRVVGIPTYVLIDKGGRVVYRDHDLPEIGKILP